MSGAIGRRPSKINSLCEIDGLGRTPGGTEPRGCVCQGQDAFLAGGNPASGRTMTRLDVASIVTEMRDSARLRADSMRPLNPRLILPPDWIDVTDQHAGEMIAVAPVNGTPAASHPWSRP
jgi:hypothetical protein